MDSLYGGWIRCEMFVDDVSGKRPFGVSILYIGWDPHFGFQLYQSDPSGNYGGWKATCIGNNHLVGVYYSLVYFLPVFHGVCVAGGHLHVKARV